MNIAIVPLLATVSAGLIEEGIADEIITERKQIIAENSISIQNHKNTAGRNKNPKKGEV